MKVNDVKTQIYLNRLNQTQKSGQPIKKNINVEMKTDKIELSNTSKEMARYIDQVKHSPLDETNRVNEIKAQLEQGTYKISSQQIAKAMTNRFN